MKTGLFGGSFDPVHCGHLIIAEWIRCELMLDSIVFMPAALSPLKTEENISSPHHRLEMLKLAVSGQSGFLISDFEIKKGGVSYTEETVEWVKTESKWRNDEIFMIIGSDSLLDLSRWKNIESWIDRITLVAAGRPKFCFSRAEEKFIEKTCLLKPPQIDISSTMIRDYVRKGRSIHFWCLKRLRII
jgi:nicotinate-nucleotide adenylyltransferase